MMRCMLRLISEVRRLPFALRNLSKRARVRSAELAGKGGRGVPGFKTSPTKTTKEQRRPNMHKMAEVVMWEVQS
eukprot:scaffold5147_cov20-Tisochrysis_lutea.AAC.2